MIRSQLELLFHEQVRTARLPPPLHDYRFHTGRKWAFDFAWPAVISAALEDTVVMIAVEVEGGTFVGGRHSRGRGYEEDCEKYAEALIAGWRVLRVTGDMVNDGRAIALLKRLFDVDGPGTPKTYEVLGSLYEHECAFGCDSKWAINCNCAGKCDKHGR